MSMDGPGGSGSGSGTTGPLATTLSLIGGTGTRVSTVSVACALRGCAASRGCGSGSTGLGFGRKIDVQGGDSTVGRSEEHTSELQSLMRISYAVFCLKKKKQKHNIDTTHQPTPYNT